jgi:uncharacterized damage-inducible protein DinB
MENPILKQMLLADAGYSAWANSILLAACAALPSDELDRDLGVSHGSILRTFRHIYYAERVWVRRLIANALPPMHQVGDQNLFRDPDPEPSLADLHTQWPHVASDLRVWLEDVSDSTLAGEMTSRMPDGADFRIRRYEIVTHSVNHSTLHRGQIIAMIRMLGHTPPNADQFSYYMARAQ